MPIFETPGGTVTVAFDQITDFVSRAEYDRRHEFVIWITPARLLLLTTLECPD